MSEAINHDRRRFLRNAAMAIAAAEFAIVGSADAESSEGKPADVLPITPGRHTSFASIKQVNAGVLDVGYAEAGPINGHAVVLLHGWPYDIHSYVDVAPLLASAGYRTIVPHLARSLKQKKYLCEAAFADCNNAGMDSLGRSVIWMFCRQQD